MRWPVFRKIEDKFFLEQGKAPEKMQEIIAALDQQNGVGSPDKKRGRKPVDPDEEQRRLKLIADWKRFCDSKAARRNSFAGTRAQR